MECPACHEHHWPYCQPLNWRRNKREARKAWCARWPQLKDRQKSHGFARHIRRAKAA